MYTNYTHHTNDDNNSSVRVKTHINYSLIQYNKSCISEQNIDTLGLYRSVVVNTDTQQIVCVSPPKSVSYSNFRDVYFELDDSIQAEEFIDGTMINIFWK